jgi:hypothetical protein
LAEKIQRSFEKNGYLGISNTEFGDMMEADYNKFVEKDFRKNGSENKSNYAAI